MYQVVQAKTLGPPSARRAHDWENYVKQVKLQVCTRSLAKRTRIGHRPMCTHAWLHVWSGSLIWHMRARSMLGSGDVDDACVCMWGILQGCPLSALLAVGSTCRLSGPPDRVGSRRAVQAVSRGTLRMGMLVGLTLFAYAFSLCFDVRFTLEVHLGSWVM